MSSQNTRKQVRLNKLMESRIRGDVYVRFGGECLETYHSQMWKGTGCLAYGQIASAKIPLSRMISPTLYWIMTGDDFTLDINNPNAPKVLDVTQIIEKELLRIENDPNLKHLLETADDE